MPAPTHTSQFYIKIGGLTVEDDFQSRIVSLIIDSTLNLPSMCVFDVMDEELKYVDDTSKFRLGNDIEVGSGENIDPEHGQSGETLFKGEITSIEPYYEAEGVTRLVVRCYDKSHRLHRARRIETYQNVTDSDVISKILGFHGLTGSIESTNVTHEHVYQNNQIDFEFIAQRARRNGYVWYTDNNKLIVGTPSGLAGPRTSVTLAYGTELTSFRPRVSIVGQQKEVTVRGWDVKKKAAIVGRASSAQFSYNNSDGNGVNAATRFGATSPLIVHEAPVGNESEAEKIAASLITGAAGGFVQGEAVAIGNPKLLAATPVKLESLGNRFSAEYFITSAMHVFSQAEGYITRFQVAGLGGATIADLLGAGAGSPATVGTETRAMGVVVGIVTNNDDPENQDRVKVKFPTLSEDVESHWVRTTHPLTGNARGFHLLPQVNDEVLVAFEHGDFNRPFVIGSLWNGKDELPDEAKSAAGNERFKVHVLKTGNGHYLLLDDRGSTESIELKTKAGHYVKLDEANKKIEIVTAGGLKTVMDDQAKKVETTAGSTKVNMDGQASSIAIEATSSITIKSSGTMKLEATGSIDVQASGVLNLKGSMVNIN